MKDRQSTSANPQNGDAIRIILILANEFWIVLNVFCSLNEG